MLNLVDIELRNLGAFCLLVMSASLLSACATIENDSRTELYQGELISIKQLSAPYPFSYPSGTSIHLSGMAVFDGGFYIVGDKPHDPYLYAVQQSKSAWLVNDQASVSLEQPASFEGMAHFNGQFILINEDPAGVYLATLTATRYESQLIDIDYAGILNPQDIAAAGQKNRGFEGVAIDVENNILFLALERQPATLLKVKLNESRTGGRLLSILSDWDSGDLDVPFSISDLYFDQGYLYSLERANYQLSKIDPDQMRVVAKLDFSFVKDAGLSLYKGEEKYGTAESLIVRENQIYIGTDNNESYVDTDNRWVQQFGLQGNQPSIIELARPQGF